MRLLAILFFVFFAFGCLPNPALAQASRTWVSGVGDDVNPCSRTAPCKTFAGAISKTASGGEINCLDPGGFGALTITKAIAIVCVGVEAGALGTGGTLIQVNLASPADAVLLSGLDIRGGPTGGGFGVRIAGVGSVHIRNSLISGFRTGTGIAFEPTGKASLLVTGTTVSNCLTGIVASGGDANPILVGSSVITGNATGISASGGATITSAGDNLLANNGSDGRFGGSKARQ